MARIRGKNTLPEVVLRRAVWARGLRYRVHVRELRGRPDLTFAGQRVLVFVDGCQWHGCPEHYVRPRSNVTFWANKLAENVARDSRQTAALEAEGWNVLRVWEHDIRRDPDGAAARVEEVVRRRAQRPRDDYRVREVEVVDPAKDLERRRMVELRSGEERVEVRRRTTAKV